MRILSNVSLQTRDGREIVANITCQFVCSLIHVLFCNCQHMSEVTLDQSLDCTFTLNTPQMPDASDDERGCRAVRRQVPG